jgi:8-oxo-dGTP pyrophosphatase MutT (NUDIX family)
MRRVCYRAAGGVVIHEGKILLLRRPSRREVRLPKGHVEEGESPAEAALREVREEAGYARLTIVADLGTQQVEFADPYRQRQVIRDEHYFLMCLHDEHRAAREEKEKQFVPIWVPAADAVRQLTFEAEGEFVRRALRWVEVNGLPSAAAGEI